ncbi:hypothetical protein OUZ56_028746 [Daphnia magna]|uniref:Uncharacterized protein n=1 Tax=Daphnia magna TaxID=35525 RepID=A0ABQ9ZW22_9CRUS|nr:hypothetical protein OUZ56_032026 [Daphnia magna]KAK4036705.1 hypothetical protein OUZ56_028746 [Daphnia magna]
MEIRIQNLARLPHRSRCQRRGDDAENRTQRAGHSATALVCLVGFVRSNSLAKLKRDSDQIINLMHGWDIPLDPDLALMVLLVEFLPDRG